MNEQNDLTVTIKAKDEASSQIEKLTSAIQGLTAKMGDASKASENISESQKKAADSHDKMAASVFKGVAAWDLLKKSMSVATDFLKSSIEESLNAEKEMALVKTNVENAGLSYASLAPKIETYSKGLISMGFAAGETGVSVSRLALVTGDYEKAVALNSLAMDLARNKNISLADATGLVTQVTQGNNRVLKQYGIELSDTATTADNLASIQDKVRGSAEAFANTTAGKLETFNERWKDIKEEVGGKLLPVVGEMIDKFEQHLPEITVLAEGVATAVGFIAEGLIGVVNAASDLGSVLGSGKTASHWKEEEKMIASTNLQIQIHNVLNKDKHIDSVTTIEDVQNLTAEQNKAIAASVAQAESMRQVKDAGEKTKNVFEGIKNTSQTSQNSTTQLTEKFKTLAETFTKVRQTAQDELQRIEDANTSAVSASVAKIADLNKSLKELKTEYSRTSAEAKRAFDTQKDQDEKSIGEAIVSQQEKIAALRKQAGSETDPQKKILLLNQLKEEEDSYASQAEFIASKSVEVAEAQRRARLTDFELAIEDYKAKRLQAEQEYADKRADALREYTARKTELKLQIDQENAKLDEQATAYKKAHAGITKALADAEAMRLETTRKSSDEVIKLIGTQISKYNRLAEAISRASQGKGVMLTTQSMPTREHGGIVPGAVGTAVPIIAHGQERIIPASQSDNAIAGSFSITINNPSVRNDHDLSLMRQMIEDAFRDVSRVHKLTTI